MDWRCQGARQLLIVLLGVAAAQVTYDDNPFNLLLFLLLDFIVLNKTSFYSLELIG